VDEKRKYTMSAAARAQRIAAARARPRAMSPAAVDRSRAAAWKTGEHGRSLLTRSVVPCKRTTCPLTNPEERGCCSIKRAINERGNNLEVCPVALTVDDGTRAKLLAAITSGDTSQVAELVATLMAGMHQLADSELAQTIKEGGFSVDADVYKDGEYVGSVAKVNPRAEPLLKLLEMVGATAAQQAITPKAAGERKRDEGIGSLLDVAKRRNAIASATGRNARALPADVPGDR